MIDYSECSFPLVDFRLSGFSRKRDREGDRRGGRLSSDIALTCVTIDFQSGVQKVYWSHETGRILVVTADVGR